MTNILKAPSQNVKDKITLWLNHLLVLYAFLIPINNNAKSSLFFTMLVLFLYRRDYWFYLKDAFSNRIVQAFLIFYLINAFGMLYTENITFGKAHMDKAKYLLFPLMFLSFLDVRFAFRIIGAFVLGMFFTELISYAINFSLLPTSFYIGKYEIYETTLFSPAPFYNHIRHNYGLAIVISYLLYQFLNKKDVSLKVKIFSIIFMTTATLNMSFIAGRTGYVIYIISILIVFILTYRERLIKAFLVALILLSTISFLGYKYSSTINIRVNQTIDSVKKVIENEDYNTSVGQRMGLTKYGFELFEKNIFFGVGVGDFMDEVRKIIPDKYAYLKDKDIIANPHDTHIQILMQLGLFGYFGLIFMFYRIFTYQELSKYNKDLLIILSISILLYMVPSKFFETFSLPLFATFVSCLIVNKNYDIDYKPFSKNTFFFYLGFVILFLIIGITR
ncbi:polymerase [Arcobacter sp. CECT 8986]|uniref:O-antigen ligase family protein n=1 Tax=Arcobacter sp. CECT 8986 TaxID=2044507 RepID=UPI001009A05F|nr:O-antigen ligase family protein [Arcobacter sp. CECT 8986]RXK01313.1 polymerase [Arcobacter sp. CECT 8986]